MTTVRRAVRMSEEAWRAIKVAAASEGLTMGEWIERRLIDNRLRSRMEELRPVRTTDE